MAKRWYYKDANGNKVPVPQYKIDADDYYTKTMSDSRYYEKSATDTMLDEKVSKTDIVQSTGTSTTAVMSQKAVSDSINKLKNAGYLYAGMATPTTNPGTPDGPVFYIANGKGTYTNFGGLEVTEDDVVILCYDTVWHKVSTGITSQAKLSELELESECIRKLSEQAEYKADLASQVVTPIDEDVFVVTDSEGNVAIRYNEDGLDTAKVSPHMMSILDGAKLVNSAEVVEDGFFIVDNALNIGLYIDGNGTHSNNLVEI